MKYHTPNGGTVEIMELSMTSAAEAPKLANLSDGLWLVIKNPNLTTAGRVKFPAVLDALGRENPASPEIAAFVATSLAKYGIDVAELTG